MIEVGIQRNWQGGTYHAWDCLNAHLVLQGTRFSRYSAIVDLTLKGLYGGRALVVAYARLPGVTRVDLNASVGDGPTICATEEGDLIHWVFDDASGDCPAGCGSHDYYYFTTRSTGPPLSLGHWMGGTPAPDWVARYGRRSATWW